MAVNRGAAYLAGTSRSVGKGWPSGHLLPDLFKVKSVVMEVTVRILGSARLFTFVKPSLMMIL